MDGIQGGAKVVEGHHSVCFSDCGGERGQLLDVAVNQQRMFGRGW